MGPQKPRENGVLHRNGAGPAALVYRGGHAAEAGRLNFSKDSFDLVFRERLSGGGGVHLAPKVVH